MTEDGGNLGRRSFLARNIRDDLADLFRQRIGSDVRGARYAQAKTAQIVVHVIVAVPAAVILREPEREDRAITEADGFFGNEYGFAVLISAAGAGVDAPGGVVIAIDGHFDRAGDAIVGGLVVEVRFELALRIAVIGAGFRDLDGNFVGGIAGIGRFDFEFGERARTFERAART